MKEMGRRFFFDLFFGNAMVCSNKKLLFWHTYDKINYLKDFAVRASIAARRF